MAKAQFEQAKLQYEKAVLLAFREVNNSIANYYFAKDLRSAQEDLVKASQGYLDLAYKRYQNGEVSYLEFLDAQRRLFDAELSLSQTIQTQLVALVEVYKALGGGWDYSDS